MMTTPNHSDPTVRPSHTVMLRWIPVANQSPRYTEIGKAWKTEHPETFRVRLLVLDQAVDLRMTPVEPAFPHDHEKVHRLLDHPPAKTCLPTHQLSIRQVMVGVAWELADQAGFNVRLCVLGQVVELVIQPER